MLVFTDNKIKLYEEDKRLADADKILNVLVKEKGLSLPIKRVWGNPTNMKPYDLGYMLLDAKKNLFRLSQRDSEITLEKIDYPKEIDLAYIQLSENNTKEILGFAIDKKSNFYLLNYDDFIFQKLALEGFDYQKMKLQFISNPLFYTIRFDNAVEYRASVYAKDLKKIDKINIR